MVIQFKYPPKMIVKKKVSLITMKQTFQYLGEVLRGEIN